jgi:hypothetical protein
MDSQRIFTAAAIACLSLLAACSAGGDFPARDNTPAAMQLSADYLREHTARNVDGIGWYRLDANMQVLPNWQGLEIGGGLQQGFVISIGTDSPDDIYLAAVYDDARYVLQDAQLTAEAANDNLLLAISRRSADLALFGISRTVDRGTARAGQELATVRFMEGYERMWRSASLVNEDPNSAVELSVENILPESVTLTWEERNIGDYDNNGIISISDITPIGILFKQTSASHDPDGEITLVDGDGNGEINLADLTPIARNFGRSLAGYSLYTLNAETNDPAQLELHSRPAVLRAEVYAAASPFERRQRLRYNTAWTPAAVGQYSLAVRTWDTDGSEGQFSNVVSVDVENGNQPPAWDGGSFMVDKQVTGLLLSFPQAIDPESEELSYRVDYAGSGDFPGSPHEGFVMVPSELTTGSPPFEYFLAELIADVLYQVELRAIDPQGAQSPALVKFERMSVLQTDLAAVWDMHGADLSRTGTISLLGLQEPLSIDQTLALDGGDALRRNEMLFSDPEAFPVAFYFASGAALHAFVIKDDANMEAPFDNYGSTEFLGAFSHTKSARYMIAADGAALWRWQFPSLAETEALSTSGELLLAGELIFSGSADGAVLLRNYFGGESFVAPATGSPSLSLSSDGDNVYQLCDDGTLRRFSMPFFEDVQSADLPVPQPGSSLICLTSLDRLVAVLPDGNVTIRSATDLTEVHATDAADGASDTCAAAVQWTDPPMLLIGESDSGPGRLRAVSLDDYTVLWDEPVQCVSISASSDRIFIRNSAELQIRDFQGRLRQSVPMAGNVNSQPALDAEGLGAVHGANLSWLEEAVSDLPPVWQGTTGLRELEVGDGQVTLRWDHALDEHGEVVNYVVYYGSVFPPDPDGLQTFIVSDLPDNGTGTHEYVLDGLQNGTRYWFIVQAYDGYLDDNPDIESNLNWLAATPPWQSEELILGEDLPAGEIFYMRGLADPAGELHIVYNDEASLALTHLYGSTGNWQSETAGLGSYSSNAFDLGWNTDLLIGRANSITANAGVLARSGPGAYSYIPLTGSVPVANPQLAVAFGDEIGFGFTEFAGGAFPDIINHYYFSSVDTGVFLPPLAIETPVENYGRDLDLLFDPLDDAAPWLSFQRGVEKDPNRLTPADGTLHFWRDLGSGLTVENVDLGDNPGESDVGKRVVMTLDGSGNPLLAYYDLDSSPGQPRGQLKTARWDGAQWSVSVLENRDLSFQDTFTYRHTAPELSLVRSAGGEIAIGELLRGNMPSSSILPHSVGVRAWIDLGSGFELEILTDLLPVLPSDREPCVAMYDGNGILHIFVATAQEPLPEDPWVADTILHLWRGG